VFETPVGPRQPTLDEADVTQILTPIFHALSGREGDTGRREPGAYVDQASLPAADPQGAELPNFDQPTEKRGTLQVISGRTAGGAHRAHGNPTTRSYSSRAGFHSKPGQPASDLTDLTGRSATPGAHRAPEGARGAVGGGAALGTSGGVAADGGATGESGSHHAVSRTGGRHRTLRAVSH
jgi:hypothetical protein